MSADVRAIDVEHIPIDPAIIVEFQMKALQDPIKQPFTRPSSITVIDRLPLAVAFGQTAVPEAATRWSLE